MADFGYSKRAQAVEIARSEVHAAFERVSNRWDEKDPNTKLWNEAIVRFRAALERAYSGSLNDFAQGEITSKEVDTADLLDFLEADPMFFGSGYMKERALTLVKQRELRSVEVKRLQGIIVNIVKNADYRREFKYYCRASVSVNGATFRENLQILERNEDRRVALRANWVLAALSGRFEEIAWASRHKDYWESKGFDYLTKAWISRNK